MPRWLMPSTGMSMGVCINRYGVVWCGVVPCPCHCIAWCSVDGGSHRVWVREREREVERTKVDVRTNMNNICIETRNKKKKKAPKRV